MTERAAMIEAGAEAAHGNAKPSEFAERVREAYGFDPLKLFPLSFAAERLSVEPKTIRSWIKSGRVKGIQLPNREWRVPGLELIRLLDPEGEWGRGC